MVNTIFISHISEEKYFALALQECIEAEFGNTHEVFVSSDLTSIQVGEQWLPAIENALERTDLMLVLCTHVSVSRPWILFESGAAWMKNVPIIPVCFAGMTAEKLPLPLGYLHAADMNVSEGIVRVFKAISSTPENDLASGIIDRTFQKLRHVSNSIVEARRQSVISVARLSLAGWLYVGIGPFLVTGIYGASLLSSGGNLELSGSVLTLAGVLVAFLVGGLHQLTQRKLRAATILLAALVFSVLAGVFSSTLYFALGSNPSVDFFSESLLDIVAFLIYVGLAFLAGAGFGDRLNTDPEVLSMLRRFFKRRNE